MTLERPLLAWMMEGRREGPRAKKPEKTRKWVLSWSPQGEPALRHLILAPMVLDCHPPDCGRMKVWSQPSVMIVSQPQHSGP